MSRQPNLENGVAASVPTFAPIYLSFRRFSLNLENGVKPRSQDDLREFLGQHAVADESALHQKWQTTVALGHSGQKQQVGICQLNCYNP